VDCSRIICPSPTMPPLASFPLVRIITPIFRAIAGAHQYPSDPNGRSLLSRVLNTLIALQYTTRHGMRRHRGKRKSNTQMEAGVRALESDQSIGSVPPSPIVAGIIPVGVSWRRFESLVVNGSLVIYTLEDGSSLASCWSMVAPVIYRRRAGRGFPQIFFSVHCLGAASEGQNGQNTTRPRF
jgi:hypothetical protein